MYIASRNEKAAACIIVTAIFFFRFSNVTLRDGCAHFRDLKFADHSEQYGKHSLVLTKNVSTLRIANHVELTNDKLSSANGFVPGVVSGQTVFSGPSHFIHRQRGTKSAVDRKSVV